MKRCVRLMALITILVTGGSGSVLAQQPLLPTSSPVEIIGTIDQVSATGREFKIESETYRLFPDALITDEEGAELPRNVLRSGDRVGMVQQGGNVSHVIVYQRRGK